jgi:hypothetical protein
MARSVTAGENCLDDRGSGARHFACNCEATSNEITPDLRRRIETYQ